MAELRGTTVGVIFQTGSGKTFLIGNGFIKRFKLPSVAPYQPKPIAEDPWRYVIGQGNIELPKSVWLAMEYLRRLDQSADENEVASVMYRAGIEMPASISREATLQVIKDGSRAMFGARRAEKIMREHGVQ